MLQLDAHQASGVSWLLEHERGMLAWEMGVGKTAPLVRAWENSRERGPALVLCLASARENWRRECIRFATDCDWPPRVQVLKDKAAPIDPGADIVILNYDKLLIPQFIKRLRAARRWGALILDEAHVLKTPGAQRTKLVYGGGHHLQTPLIDHAERVWLATGTPMPNHPAELWTHAWHLWPETLLYQGKPMDLATFELGFCQIRQNKYGYQVTGGKNLAELRDRMAPVISRLKRKDVLDLPPLRIDSWPLDAETTSGVGRVPDLPDLLTTLSEKYGPPSSIDCFDLATLNAYLEVAAGSYIPLATLRRETATLKSILTGLLVKEELEQGAPKTVIFAHHREAITTLEKILAGFNPAVIHGGVATGGKTDRRQEQVDKFQNDATCRVFIGQIQAAGTSINLQAGSRVVFVEASWTPGENEQALSRVYRKGQTEPVLVRFVYLPGSIDEAINRALARKVAMISQVLN